MNITGLYPPPSCCPINSISDCIPEPGEGCLRAMGIFITRGSAFIASTAVVTAFTQVS